MSDLNDTNLISINIGTFPEPIYLALYLDTINNNYLAAGRSTVYVSVNGKIGTQRSYDSEVTGTRTNILVVFALTVMHRNDLL